MRHVEQISMTSTMNEEIKAPTFMVLVDFLASAFANIIH